MVNDGCVAVRAAKTLMPRLRNTWSGGSDGGGGGGAVSGTRVRTSASGAGDCGVRPVCPQSAQSVPSSHLTLAGRRRLADEPSSQIPSEAERQLLEHGR